MSRRPRSLSHLSASDSMIELVPSPIPDSPPLSPSKPGRSSSSSLPPLPGNTYSSLPLWFSRTQRFSAYTFTTFLGLHFTTTSLIPLTTLSLPTSNNGLLLFRTLTYQSLSPYTEIFLIPLSLTTHILSGLALRIRRHYVAKRRYGVGPSFFEPANWSTVSVTGWMLVPLICLHTGITRVVPLLVDGDGGDVGLGIVAHGFAYKGGEGGWWGKFGWLLTAGYFVGFVGAATWHVVHGFTKFLRLRPRRRTTALISASLSLVWLSAVFAVIVPAGRAQGYLGEKYDQYYDVFFGRALSL